MDVDGRQTRIGGHVLSKLKIDMHPDSDIWDVVVQLMRKTTKGNLEWAMDRGDNRKHCIHGEGPVESYDGPVLATIGDYDVRLFSDGRMEVYDGRKKYVWEQEAISRDLYRAARNSVWTGENKEEVASSLKQALNQE